MELLNCNKFTEKKSRRKRNLTGGVTVFLLCIGLFLNSCEDDPASTDPGDDPVDVQASFVVDPEEPNVNEEVTLDASSSSVDNNGTLDYTWTLTTPSDSDAELDSDSGEMNNFTPDVDGEYVIDLSVSANGETDEASETIEVSSLTVEEITSDITEDMTLSSDMLYIVTGDFDVEAVLTIEPGTTVEFEQSAGLSPRNGGAINAIGTDEDPILLTGTEQNPGWWNGIWFRSSTNFENQMEYVTIEYAGDDLDAAIEIGGTIGAQEGYLELRNSTIQETDGAGLLLSEDAELAESSDNVFTQNDAPVILLAKNAHHLDGASTYTGNSDDYIMVGGEDIENEDVTWNLLDVPYQISGDIELHDIEFTLEAGNQLVFDQGVRMEVRDGASLVAEGTESESILFTGLQESDGYWDGIWFRSSTSINNVMDHVIVEYAGNDLDGAIEVGGTIGSQVGALDLRNSTIRNSGSAGLYLSEDAEIRDGSNNVFTENDVPAVVLSENAHYLDETSDYSGNSDDYIHVMENDDIDGDDVTWQNHNVPYLVNGTTTIQGVTLTIDEGATLMFEEQASMQYRDNATIVAIGSEDEPITFTGSQDSAGWWEGIWIRSSTSSNNEISHATIEYAGYDREGALKLGGTLSSQEGYIELTNSTVQDNDSYGVWGSEDSDANDDICSDNDFSNNADGDCLMEE